MRQNAAPCKCEDPFDPLAGLPKSKLVARRPARKCFPGRRGFSRRTIRIVCVLHKKRRALGRSVAKSGKVGGVQAMQLTMALSHVATILVFLFAAAFSWRDLMEPIRFRSNRKRALTCRVCRASFRKDASHLRGKPESMVFRTTRCPDYSGAHKPGSSSSPARNWQYGVSLSLFLRAPACPRCSSGSQDRRR